MQGLTKPWLGGPTLAHSAIARLADQTCAVIPRWLTSDTAALERSLSADQWLDARRIELRLDPAGVWVRNSDEVSLGPIRTLILDHGGAKPDLSTWGRRATYALGHLRGDPSAEVLDLALCLTRSDVKLLTIDTQDVRLASRQVAELLS